MQCLCVVAALIVVLWFTRKNEHAWTVDFTEIELKQQIGAGGYGAVHKAVWKDSDVAVKLLANSSQLTRVSYYVIIGLSYINLIRA